MDELFLEVPHEEAISIAQVIATKLENLFIMFVLVVSAADSGTDGVVLNRKCGA